jgi:hypothetical protein
MAKKSMRTKTASAHHSPSDAKGRLVEQIAAQMHQAPSVTVETRASVPTIGHSTRTREIDVLLTSEVAGYPVHVAIECKNEKTPIGAPMIDGFIGKLEDIGIPRQQGIFISASGYTSGAIERATQAGIRPLILWGLTKDALSSEVAEAFQSIVYLLPQVSKLSFHGANRPARDFVDILRFYDPSGQLAALLPQVIWQQWMQGEPPSVLGEHELRLVVPDGWYQLIDGEKVTYEGITVTILVTGLVVTLRGKATQHALVNAANQTVERSHLSAKFHPAAGDSSVTTILTEADLDVFFLKPAVLTVQTGRIRIPRIIFVDGYWPPSERVARKVYELMQAFERGEIPDPRPFRFEELEGTNMEVMWESLWDGNFETLKTAAPIGNAPEIQGK